MPCFLHVTNENVVCVLDFSFVLTGVIPFFGLGKDSSPYSPDHMKIWISLEFVDISNGKQTAFLVTNSYVSVQICAFKMAEVNTI